ncbi:MAG: hypothetical protein KKA79_00295, partial [Nanoarchaeota archaeon]|nr:hypothetical protein [Nanoarchaeota archaeon]
MKKAVFICIVFFIMVVSGVIAGYQDELSVMFHSFGKNTTIDLKKYLGESEYYITSSSLNVIVNINQNTGIATLAARPVWEGSEVIFFRKNESIAKTNQIELAAKYLPPIYLPPIPETLYLRKVGDEELVRLFEWTIDPRILDFIKDIKREEIKNLSISIDKNKLEMSINEELDLNVELGYIPSVSMDLSLGEKKEEPEREAIEKSKAGFEINYIIIGVFVILLIIAIYLYVKYAKKLSIEKKETELDYVITKDIKRLAIFRLRKLQKDPTTEKFLNIMREFFSKYFKIGYNF